MREHLTIYVKIEFFYKLLKFFKNGSVVQGAGVYRWSGIYMFSGVYRWSGIYMFSGAYRWSGIYVLAWRGRSPYCWVLSRKHPG
jgi:hypothetical protein